MTTIICAAQSGTENAALLGMGIGAAVVIIFGLFVLSIILGGIFMYFGASVAKVEERTFSKAIIAALLASLGGSFVGGIFMLLPLIGPFLGSLANIAAQIFIIKAIFNTDTGKAVVTWVFNLLAQLIVVAIAAIIFWSAIAGMLIAAN